MSIISNLKNMDKTFSWSFLGFLMAVLFGAISIYLGFFKIEKPDLKYIITSDSSVLDIKEKVGSLDVLYNGESISKRKQDLRFITFRVINQGNSSILSNFYDSEFPIGFKVKNGEIADHPKLVSASNDYLKSRLVTTMISKTHVTFSNVILEPNESFDIKILVLHEAGEKPTIQTIGKIATIDRIDVIKEFSPSNESSKTESIFGGGLWHQVIRLFTYGFGFVFILLLNLLIHETIAHQRNKRRRRLLTLSFKDYHFEKACEIDNFFSTTI